VLTVSPVSLRPVSASPGFPPLLLGPAETAAEPVDVVVLLPHPVTIRARVQAAAARLEARIPGVLVMCSR
jgi:hypothetical protein